MAEEIKIRAIMIVEIMGRPAEHVKESLENHVGQLKKVKGVEVFSISVSEPKKLEDIKEGGYTCFAEVEFETWSLSKLIELVFDFMPSSIEILSPENLNLNLSDATGFLNDLSGRLHRYDEVAKIAQIQNQQMFMKLKEMGAIDESRGGEEEKKK